MPKRSVVRGCLAKGKKLRFIQSMKFSAQVQLPYEIKFAAQIESALRNKCYATPFFAFNAKNSSRLFASTSSNPISLLIVNKGTTVALTRIGANHPHLCR